MAGSKAFLIGGNVLRTTVINKKTVEKFKKAGYEVLAKDKDGRGFRLQSGKQRLYIFAQNLYAQEI